MRAGNVVVCCLMGLLSGCKTEMCMRDISAQISGRVESKGIAVAGATVALLSHRVEGWAVSAADGSYSLERPREIELACDAPRSLEVQQPYLGACWMEQQVISATSFADKQREVIVHQGAVDHGAVSLDPIADHQPPIALDCDMTSSERLYVLWSESAACAEQEILATLDFPVSGKLQRRAKALCQPDRHQSMLILVTTADYETESCSTDSEGGSYCSTETVTETPRSIEFTLAGVADPLGNGAQALVRCLE